MEINLEVRRESVESIEMAFKAKGLNEISNIMSRDRDKDKALNHLVVNSQRIGRKKEIAKHLRSDQARR